MRKIFIATFVIFFVPVLLWAQSKRPNQFVNLKFWIKADSLGKTYTANAQVDSIRNWGSTGGWLTQSTAGNRPLYRTSASTTGLPGVDFDGTDDNMSHPSSTALYKFLHDGTGCTLFIVYIEDANVGGDNDFIFHTNSAGSSNIGAIFQHRATGALLYTVTNGSGTQVINAITDQLFNYVGATQFAVFTYATANTPDEKARMDGQWQSSSLTINNNGTPSTASSTVDLTLGFTDGNTLNGKILEMFFYSGTKTSAQIDTLENYIRSKWIASPTAIYRSVQPGNTSAIATNSLGTLTISGSTATFSAPLPDSVGVGCVIQYDADNNGTVDNLAFIHGRTSSTVFTVKDSLGGTTYLNAVTGDDAWSIFHAYTTLSGWEGGTENTGIAAGLRNFDAGNRAVFVNNEKWYVALYKGTETGITTVTVDWATGPATLDNSITLYTPRLTSEVGTSQFHNGSFTGGYRYVYNGSGNVNIWTFQAGNVIVDGVVMNMSAVITNAAANILLLSVTGIYSQTEIKNSIIKGNPSSIPAGYNIFISGDAIDTLVAKISNNYIYSALSTAGEGVGILSNNAISIAYVYNNTIYGNSDYGIERTGGAIFAKNNISNNTANDFSGTITQEYNASGDATASGTGSRISQTFSFTNTSTGDFSLTVSDTAARNKGEDLGTNVILPIPFDMVGTLRPVGSAYDIGAWEQTTSDAVYAVGWGRSSRHWQPQRYHWRNILQ